MAEGEEKTKGLKRKRVTTRERYEKAITEDILAADILNIFKLGRIVRSTETCIRWLQDVGLLKKDMVCGSEACGWRAMVMKQHKSAFLVDEGYCFYCNKCKCRKSVRADSFFETLKICLPEELLLLTDFLKLSKETHVAVDQGIEQHTISDHYRYFRDVCIVWWQEKMENITFDPEETIEIDESLFGRKVKYGKGENCKVKMWVFGMVGRDSGRVIAYPVPNRKSETLLPLILKHTSKTNLIVHDDWSAYRSLATERDHFVVTPKTDFKTTFNIIKKGGKIGQLAQMKQHLKNCRRVSLNLLPSYLAHILFMVNNRRENWCREYMRNLKKMYISGDVQPKRPIFKLFEEAPYEAFDDGNEKYENGELIENDSFNDTDNE